MEHVDITYRRAKHDFFFVKSENAGIQLTGPEVKAVRKGKASLADSHCFFDKGELYVKGLHIADVENPTRNKKLLLKRSELRKIEKEVEKGMTLLVYRVHGKGLLKAEVVLAKGKKQYDKRETIKKRESDREIARSLS